MLRSKTIRLLNALILLTVLGVFASCDNSPNQPKPPPAKPTLSIDGLIGSGDGHVDNSGQAPTLSGTVKLKITATNIKNVKFYLDNNLIKTIPSPPFKLKINTRHYKNGKHTLKVTAEANDQTQASVLNLFDFLFPQKQWQNHPVVV